MTQRASFLQSSFTPPPCTMADVRDRLSPAGGGGGNRCLADRVPSWCKLV